MLLPTTVTVEAVIITIFKRFKRPIRSIIKLAEAWAPVKDVASLDLKITKSVHLQFHQ